MYNCPRCGARYAHDQAYRHAVFLCPNRKEPAHVHGTRVLDSDVGLGGL
jgi:transcription initiation factor IIE alpha subunit